MTQCASLHSFRYIGLPRCRECFCISNWHWFDFHPGVSQGNDGKVMQKEKECVPANIEANLWILVYPCVSFRVGLATSRLLCSAVTPTAALWSSQSEKTSPSSGNTAAESQLPNYLQHLVTGRGAMFVPMRTFRNCCSAISYMTNQLMAP